MRLSAHQMAKLAAEMNKASQEIDAVLCSEVSVTHAAASTPLVPHLQTLASTLHTIGHMGRIA